MPIYEFECKKCKIIYETMAEYDETEKYKKVSCPKCKSKSKTKLLSSCGFNFTNPVGTDRWVSDSTGHDYRYNYNLPNVHKQREFAQQNSHVGPNPYAGLNLPEE